MRLNKNQQLNHVRNAMKGLRLVTDGLEEDDIRAIMEQCNALLLPNDDKPAADNTPEAMKDRILAAINDGLKSSDPQMVRAAMEWVQEHAGREYLKELHVNIVPYELADKSLDKIIAECDEDRFAEIIAAVGKRQKP